VKSKIPARIIQTGRSLDLPLLAKAAVANLKRLHPDFEYHFFDDHQVTAFIRSEFPEYCEVFEAFPLRIQKYDFFRYLAVYRLGGFYFDLDVFFAMSLDQLPIATCIFPFEELTISRYLRRRGIDWEIGNYAFGSVAGHPFLQAAIENCVRAQQSPAWVEPMMRGIPRLFRAEFYVLNTTGPGLLSRTLAENLGLAKDVAILFPDDVCDHRTWHQFGNFGVHLQEGSWRSKHGYLRRRLANLWECRARRRLNRESRALGRTRSMAKATEVRGQRSEVSGLIVAADL
jgi:hypothetical protein